MIYKIASGQIVRDDGATIPADTNNRDYREYLAWVGAGNTAAIDGVDKIEQTLRAQDTDVIGDLRSSYEVYVLQGNLPQANKIRREISRIKYMSRGV